MSETIIKRKPDFISKPLFKQSLKSLLGLWIALMIGSALIFVAVNLAIGSKNIFTNVNMDAVPKQCLVVR